MMTTLSLPILRFESSAREEIHRERRGQCGDFDQIPGLLAQLAPQLHALAVPADRIDQPADDRPPYAGPERDLLDQLRGIFAHNIGRGARFLALSGQKDLSQVGVERDIDARLPLLLGLTVKLLDRNV